MANETTTKGAAGLDPHVVTAILDAVDAGFDRQIELTRALVMTPSLRGEEGPAQDFLAECFRARGYGVDRFPMDRAALARHPGGGRITEEHSDADIVVAHAGADGGKGRSLILQGHVDVVPPGPRRLWSHPPFSARIDGDWLYGRGGGDMKAGCVANFACLDALACAGFAPDAPVVIQSVVEEESTGNGALMTHLKGYRGDAVLIPEPEDEMLVRANVGVLWFSVTVSGSPAHVRAMETGKDAIGAAFGLIGALRELAADWNRRAREHPAFGEGPPPINLNIGRIEGGDWPSSVAGACRFDARIAILPGTAAADAAAEIETCIRRAALAAGMGGNALPEVRWTGFFSEGYVLEPGSAAEAVLAEAHARAAGAPLRSFNTFSYLDTRVYALYDKVPALCYGPLAENVHGPDERVSIASIRRVTGAMALFVARWCGLRPLPT
ncbi:MAG: ArgE/DapE family deacylase [Rhodobacteraceae bacterium]|nr:MAG: ArgE/DapE family deacylase [Paracoccaceae bacterium]